MQGFTTTVKLPDDLNHAIIQAVNDAFTSAKAQLSNGSDYPMYMNVKQTTDYLGISYNTFKKWVNRYPDFPVSVVDGSYRVNRNELDKFMLSMQNK